MKQEQEPTPNGSTETVTCCLPSHGMVGMTMRGNIVDSLKPGSEPACAGVRKGDRVVKVDDTVVSNDQWFCLEAMIGDDDSEVTLTLQRAVTDRRHRDTQSSQTAAPATNGLAPVDDWATFQMPMAASNNKNKGHVRRASAPPGFGSKAEPTDKESQKLSPRTVLGEGKEEPESPASKIKSLRSWWAIKKADKVPAAAAATLPTMPFLDEAFEDDAGEDKGLLFD